MSGYSRTDTNTYTKNPSASHPIQNAAIKVNRRLFWPKPGINDVEAERKFDMYRKSPAASVKEEEDERYNILRSLQADFVRDRNAAKKAISDAEKADKVANASELALVEATKHGNLEKIEEAQNKAEADRALAIRAHEYIVEAKATAAGSEEKYNASKPSTLAENKRIAEEDKRIAEENKRREEEEKRKEEEEEKRKEEEEETRERESKINEAYKKGLKPDWGTPEQAIAEAQKRTAETEKDDFKAGRKRKSAKRKSTKQKKNKQKKNKQKKQTKKRRGKTARK